MVLSMKKTYRTTQIFIFLWWNKKYLPVGLHNFHEIYLVCCVSCDLFCFEWDLRLALCAPLTSESGMPYLDSLEHQSSDQKHHTLYDRDKHKTVWWKSKHVTSLFGDYNDSIFFLGRLFSKHIRSPFSFSRAMEKKKWRKLSTKSLPCVFLKHVKALTEWW
jgi:hypothetical protein